MLSTGLLTSYVPARAVRSLMIKTSPNDRETPCVQQKCAKTKLPELLVWPSSLLSSSSSSRRRRIERKGFVVGWHTPEVISSKSDLSLKHCRSVVVAGILPPLLPSSDTTGKHETFRSLAEEYATLQSRIQMLKEDSCFCCPRVNTSNYRTSDCPDWTRIVCLENLEIVAYFDPEHLDNNNPRSQKEKFYTVPILTRSSRGYVWWAKDNEEKDRDVADDKDGHHQDQRTTQQQRQLLIYDNGGILKCDNEGEDNHSLLYRCDEASEGSFFSTIFLSRLTHALHVLDLVAVQQPASLSSSKATITRHKNKEKTAASPKEPARHYDEKEEPSSCDTIIDLLLIRKSYINAFLRRYSMFIRHVCHRDKDTAGFLDRVPLLRLLHHLRSDKTTGLNSSAPCYVPKTFLKSKYKSAQQRIASFNTLCISGLDAIMGLMLGIAIARFLSTPDHTLFLTLWKQHYQLLRDSLNWLENFPIGFKLNERLTEHMGRGLRYLVDLHERTVSSSGSIILLVFHQQPEQVSKFISMAIALSAGVGLGGSGLLALLFDSFQIFGAHVFVFAAFYRKIYQAELYLLTALWRLFRGKKKNILRHRTDTMEYDFMQLLLGTILFAFALFLFTTVLVYHVFFAALRIIVAMASLAIIIPYILIRLFPIGSILLRKKCPGWFTSNVYLLEEDSVEVAKEDIASTGVFDVTWLVAVPLSFASILTDALVLPFGALKCWLASLIVELFSGTSSPSTHVVNQLFNNLHDKIAFRDANCESNGPIINNNK